MAEISPIKFSKELNKVLFPENAFYKKSMTDEAKYKTIHIPEAGVTGTASVGDYPSLPLSIQKRTDTVTSYTTDEVYLTNPVLIEREDEILLNYSKMKDVVTAAGHILNTKIADIAATNFAPTSTVLGNVFATTGTNTRTSALVGSTVTAKRLLMADLLKVKKYFDKSNLPDGQIYGLLTPEFVEDLFYIDELVDYDKTGELTKLRNGEIGRILGMQFMTRWNSTLGTNGVSYTNGGVKKALGAAVAATDRAAIIFWHSSAVRHAEGFAKTVINRDAPGYKGGTIIEAMVRFGATINRTDELGVAAIYEGA